MATLEYRNLDRTAAFKKLKDLARVDLHSALTVERIAAYSMPMAAGLTFNYAARQVDEKILAVLAELAAEQQVLAKYRALAGGEIMNPGEGRMVLHHLLRGQLGKEVVSEGKNLRVFYEEQRGRFTRFAEAVHGGSIRGSTGKPFTTVVQIGIGGSDLGPRALYLALQTHAASHPGAMKMQARFISNVDPDDANETLRGLDFESSLFILVSKSGTTQETLTNRQFVLAKMRAARIPGLTPERHMIAVTSETSPMAKSKDYLDSFFIDDFIGGRYSATSAVGGVLLTLAYGSRLFEAILKGAHEADLSALEADIRKNPSLMDALIGVYERNVLAYPTTAVLPYSQALIRFPAHLQQLDMESNGKSVSRSGEPLAYATGPILFGEPGTNGQHSFYQHLHQGTDPVPLQFIGFQESQDDFDLVTEGVTSRTKLAANLAAQIVAFALGKSDANPNKGFAGNRPSSLIYGRQLTPESLGALLAHYENKVMFQGFLWNVNSFDQEGVQLGKVLTSRILKGDGLDPVIAAYAKVLGVI